MYLRKSRLKGDLIMVSEKFVMRFGEENDIDLETLSISLDVMVDTLKNSSNNLINENGSCKLRVLNIQKGNLVINIEQIVEIAPTIMPVMPTTIKTSKEVLEIREFLKGSPLKEIAKSNDVTKIEDKYGDVYYTNAMTVSIYDNDIEKGMAITTKTVLNNSDRTGLSYEFVDGKGKKDCLDLNRENLSYSSIPQDVDKFNKGIEESEVTTWVKVDKPSLNGKSQWGLTLNGGRISYIISDQEFFDKVYDDETLFLNNTKLYVKMVVRYKTRSFESGESSKIISRNIIKVFEIQNSQHPTRCFSFPQKGV